MDTLAAQFIDPVLSMTSASSSRPDELTTCAETFTAMESIPVPFLREFSQWQEDRLHRSGRGDLEALVELLDIVALHAELVVADDDGIDIVVMNVFAFAAL